MCHEILHKKSLGWNYLLGADLLHQILQSLRNIENCVLLLFPHAYLGSIWTTQGKNMLNLPKEDQDVQICGPP